MYIYIYIHMYMQHPATHCNTPLQHTATHNTPLQHAATQGTCCAIYVCDNERGREKEKECVSEKICERGKGDERTCA